MALPGVRTVVKGDSLGKLKILFYGKRGVGKTHLAASCNDDEELGPILHVSLEPTDATLEERGDVDSIPCPSVFEANNPIKDKKDPLYIPSVEELIAMWYAGNEDLRGYKTWVIDSVTELEEMNLESIRLKNSKNAMLELQDYGKNTNGLMFMFRALRDLPVNVIFLALEEDIIKGGGQNAVATGVRPALTKKLAKKILGYVDHVWYILRGEDGKRWIYTQPTPKFEAKTRGSSFGKRLEDQLPADPSMVDVMDIYHDRYEVKKENEND